MTQAWVNMGFSEWAVPLMSPTHILILYVLVT